MRILVVEDDLEAQRYLVNGLKEAGHVVDDAGDGDRRARAQRLLHSPQRFFPMRRLDQNETARIETKSAQAMTVRTAVIAKPIGR